MYTHRYEEALLEFERVTKQTPDFPGGFIRLGEVRIRRAQYAEALTDFEHAISSDPGDYLAAWCLYNKGVIYQITNELSRSDENLNAAIELYGRVIRDNPRDWENVFNKALCHLAAGNTEEAARIYKQGVAEGASPLDIKTAGRDLKEFLKLFPARTEAESLLEFLSGRD
jgi:tetratricopeptide (TPR) repeat protein